MSDRVSMLLDPKAFMKQATQKQKTASLAARPETPSMSALTSSSPKSKSQVQSPSNLTSPSTSRIYDPRTLLNPRNVPRQAFQPQLQGSAASPYIATVHRSLSPSRDAMDIAGVSQRRELLRESSGSASRLEDLYGVERRVEQPRKKVKRDSNDADEHKNNSHKAYAHRSDGMIGQYMKPDADKPVALMVDLTNDNDDDDDDVLITGINNIGMQEVCFGHVKATVLAHHTPKPRAEAKSILQDEWPVIKCNASRVSGSTMVIDVADPHGFVFGKIDFDMACVLTPAIDGLEKFRVQARLMNRKRRVNEWPHQPCSETIPISLNLYGLRRDALRIGKLFGQRNIWFKPPMASEAGYPFENPQPQRRIIQQQNRDSRGRPILADNRTVEEANQMVTKLFDHGSSAASELQETEPLPTILTDLLPHQKQGLTFMIQREKPRTFGTEEGENSSLWRKGVDKKGETIYQEVVSGISVKREPEEVFGGLLGDDMGLGKTIQTLSLLAATTEEAATFGNANVMRAAEGDVNVKAQTKGTLLICPVSTIKNWEDQIPEHIKAETFKYYIYHGSNRIQNPFELTKYDIIITTYGTVNAEVNGRSAKSGLSPLLQLKWFRIVLDEAHTIRESGTKQSKAICELHAQRRWCLTGTAIQNRIDDLGSLTKFLRIYPYDTVARFNQYIRGPATTGDANFMQSLRVFVDSFSLRRLKDRIDLPKRYEPIVTLPFNYEERKLHDFFKDISNVQIEKMTKRRGADEKGGKEMHSVLQGILALRRIAAHGRELLNDKDLAKVRGITRDEAIDVDEEQEVKLLSIHEASSHLSMLAEAALDFCRTCSKRVGGDSPSAESNDGVDGVRCYVLPCYDIVCHDCFEEFKESFDGQPDTATSTCPLCQAIIASQYVAISAVSAEGLELAPDESAPEEDPGDVERQYGGPHTKTKALLNDIQEMKEQSASLVQAGEPPLKCVVFSEWTQHLDLIERALSDYDCTYVRIDGKMSLPKRRKVLDAFSADDGVTILLASIKAAGQGLNLTAASRVFIMEPLWNPAAEVQAVDRVHRIGQKREVIITRYRMENSIEQKIGQLQQKKIKLADVSMNRNHKKLSQKELREQNLKDIAALFK